MASCCDKESRSDSQIFKYRYQPLKDLTHYTCDPPCLCRIIDTRSNWDRIQYQWMEKNKQPKIPPASQKFIQSWNNK